MRGDREGDHEPQTQQGLEKPNEMVLGVNVGVYGSIVADILYGNFHAY